MIINELLFIKCLDALCYVHNQQPSFDRKTLCWEGVPQERTGRRFICASGELKEM